MCDVFRRLLAWQQVACRGWGLHVGPDPILLPAFGAVAVGNEITVSGCSCCQLSGCPTVKWPNYPTARC